MEHCVCLNEICILVALMRELSRSSKHLPRARVKVLHEVSHKGGWHRQLFKLKEMSEVKSLYYYNYSILYLKKVRNSQWSVSKQNRQIQATKEKQKNHSAWLFLFLLLFFLSGGRRMSTSDSELPPVDWGDPPAIAESKPRQEATMTKWEVKYPYRVSHATSQKLKN
jgi:hypothetical protein